ncbi:MAG: carboxylesterase/lipase family protein [Acidobacteria bacterium]|nr:carboxylesterase/lipase family protein [Acidobacteriota bacterium]
MANRHFDVSRRQILKSSLFGTAFAALPAFATRTAEAAAESSSMSAVVDTTGGKVRGVVSNGVHVYRGIPYGAPTSGANRFMAPRKAEPWTGVRDAFQNGHSSPQVAPPPAAIGAGLRGYAAQGEDCLALNVFSTGVNDGRKRPVMMWIHGGGYTYGSGSSLGYDGANLSRVGDVVVVCINHRLAVNGHLYLGAVGADFADSGNVGMLDIVASLQWVRDNIAQFGGDPGNVTIFGQSGGGGKVSTLLAMPSAKGLFHKAIVESGSTLKQMTRDEAQKTTDQVAGRLGLKPTQVAELQQVPLPKLLAAMGTGTRFGPVVDGHSLPRDPFDPNAPEVSADVPLIIGTTETEGSYFAPPELLSLDEAAVRARLTERLAGDGDRVYDLFKKSRPKATPSEIYFTISAFPINAHIQAERKAAQRRAPAFLYQIRWRTPVEGGRRLSPHCIEIPFAMQNHWQLPEMVGTGPELQPLADKVSGAWLAFARTGNPSHPGIPKWPAYNATERSTMHINNVWTLANDPDREERLALVALARLPMF